MSSRDYTKDIGNHSKSKKLSRPVTFIILAAVAVGASFGVAAILAQAKERDHEAKSESAPAGTAPASAGPTPATAPHK